MTNEIRVIEVVTTNVKDFPDIENVQLNTMMKVSKFVAKIMGKSQSKLKQKQLDRLQGETKFSREELQDLYRGIIEMHLPFVNPWPTVFTWLTYIF